MLTKEQILEVKDRYISLLRKIKRKDADIEGLIKYLEDTDFFNAPASTQYHCSFPGGLCLHSLNVFDALVELTKNDDRYSEDTIAIVGLLHDLSKINFYELSSKNEKVYSSSGSKYDDLGHFDWVTTKCYKVKDADNRTIIGTKGFKSYMLANAFIPLTREESVALANQYSATDRTPIDELSNILAKYNLAVYLHSADIIATYCIERPQNDK